jgi:uncharacterized membrane protein
MFCPNCGAQVEATAPFCPNCGAPQETAGRVPPPPPSPAQQVVVGPIVPKSNEIRTGAWISEAWQIVQSDLGNFVLGALIVAAISSVGSFIVRGPMQSGFEYATIRKLHTGRFDLNDVFKGFNFFLPTLIASILIGIFSFLGFMLCIVPGIVVMAMYNFSYLFIVDKKFDFWPAMQASHDIVKRDYLGHSLFILALALINVVGFLLCFVGLLITIPITTVAVVLAYRDLVGFERATLEQGV